MKGFICYLLDRERELLKYLLRIVVFVPIIFVGGLISILWLALKFKGIPFSGERLMSVLPTILALGFLVSGAGLVNMFLKHWQEYVQKKRVKG